MALVKKGTLFGWPPIVWAGLSIASLMWVAKLAKERTGPKFLFGVPVSSSITIPPNKRWLVELRNGDRTQMSSAQLQQAIDAHGVKTYQEIKQTA
jgi:hypothetical protein